MKEKTENALLWTAAIVFSALFYAQIFFPDLGFIFLTVQAVSVILGVVAGLAWKLWNSLH